MKSLRPAFVRASISFPADMHQSLEDLAKQKKVSLAWVVRDAAEQYIAHMKPQAVEGQKQVRTAGKLVRKAT